MTRLHFRKLILITILCFSLSESKTLTCLNNAGAQTDWTQTQIFPTSINMVESQLRQLKNTNGANGEPNNPYAYTDSGSSSIKYDVYSNPINFEQSWLYKTVNLVNTHEHDLQLIAWNDAPPLGNTDTYHAHSKGVIVLDEQSGTGIYIQHSIPNYPYITPGGQIDVSISPNQSIYAQNMFCVSLTGDQLNQIAWNLINTNINIYFKKLTTTAAKYQNLITLIDSKASSSQRRKNPDYMQKDFTIAGSKWTYFSTKSTGDLLIWDEVVAPYYNRKLLCETWGRPWTPSLCKYTDYEAENVQSIKINSAISWKSTQDHSKWCVEDSYYIHLVCLGDMNRQDSQARRGGSAWCTKNTRLWKVLRNVVDKVEWCDSGAKEEMNISYRDLLLRQVEQLNTKWD